MADQEIGKRFHVKAEDLPEPNATPAVRNAALTIERGDRVPEAPEGFEVTLFADGLANPRQMLVLDNGDVLLAQQAAGEVWLLRDEDSDGQADTLSLFATNFEKPYGLAYRGNELLVADVRGIWVVPHAERAIRATGSVIFATQPLDEVPPEERRPQTPVDHLPLTEQGVFGEPIGHTTRSLAIDPESDRLYVGVGSAGNISVEKPPRATVQTFAPDGTDQQTFATGTRNPIGVGFHPETGEFWAVVQERDTLGDGLVPDYFTRIDEGDFFGWPYAYIGPNPMPGFAERAPELVENTEVPDVLFEAHSAAMDFAFHDGTNMPEDYAGDAFVALKGSWNRSDPTGYKVVRVLFDEDNQPTGAYENFLTGFWVEGQERAVIWGRPADVAVLPDGALLIADDTGGTIWHVAHTGGAKDGGQREAQARQPNGE